MVCSLSTLSASHPELVQHIAFFASEPLGPPSALLALLLTAKSLHACLSPNPDNAYLYDRIFRLKFDVAAARRRLGPTTITSSSLQQELIKRCAALQRIRSGDIYSRHLREDLWLTYLMMIESDGRNEVQLLEWAHLRGFILEYLEKRLYEASDVNNGWPLETDENALAVWLLWLTTDRVKLRNEPELIRQALIKRLEPYCVGAFKYATHYYPETHFLLPIFGSSSSNPVPTTTTPHGSYPIYRPMLSSLHPTVTHFGRQLTMCAPPLVPAALLCWFVRSERLGVEWQGHLRTRADLENDPDAPQWGIATVEDFEEWSRATTKCVQRVQPIASVSFLDDDDDVAGGGEMQILKSHADRVLEEWWTGEMPRGSVRHEHEWQRMMRCFNPYLDAKLKIRIYTPGMLSGTWEGRMLSHNPSEYTRLYNRDSIPPPSEDSVFPTQYLHALYATFHEHHHLPSVKRHPSMPKVRTGTESGNTSHYTAGNRNEDNGGLVAEPDAEYINMPAPGGGDGGGMDGDGVCNAWFPNDAEFRERNGRLRIDIPSTGEHTTYETHVPGRPNSHIAAGGCESCRSELASSSPTVSRVHRFPSRSPRRSSPSQRHRGSSSQTRSSRLRSPSPELIPEEWEQIFYENGMSDSDDYSDTDDSDVEMAENDEDEVEAGEVDVMEVDGDSKGDHDGRLDVPELLNMEPKGKTKNRKIKEPLLDYVRNGCVRDIVITGETDYNHGRAWGAYKFYGRVRDADGLIVLIRIPIEPNTRFAGTYIFRGYIHSGLNFVGRWRVAHHDPYSVTNLEGTFTLCKRIL